MCVKTVVNGLVASIAGLLVSTMAWAGDAPYQGTPNLEEVSFEASDGKMVFADLFKAEGETPAPLIILYHQASGSARGEYKTIVPRLVGEGYSVLAVDQRSGGDYFGAPNRTVAQYEQEIGFCEAYPDMLAALDYAKEKIPSRRFVWGSSYSAGLILNMGAERGEDMTAILSFSPAASGPMEPCSSTPIVKDIKVPVLALRPAKEMVYESSQVQLNNFKDLGFETYVSENGVHGSSMLVQERTEADTEATWAVVLDFLARNSKAP